MLSIVILQLKMTNCSDWKRFTLDVYLTKAGGKLGDP